MPIKEKSPQYSTLKAPHRAASQLSCFKGFDFIYFQKIYQKYLGTGSNSKNCYKWNNCLNFVYLNIRITTLHYDERQLHLNVFLSGHVPVFSFLFFTYKYNRYSWYILTFPYWQEDTGYHTVKLAQVTFLAWLIFPSMLYICTVTYLYNLNIFDGLRNKLQSNPF